MKVYIGATRVDSQSCYLREFLFPVDGPLLMLIYILGYMSPSRPAGGLGDSPDGAACTYIAPPHLMENYLGFISSLTTPLNRRNLI